MLLPLGNSSSLATLATLLRCASVSDEKKLAVAIAASGDAPARVALSALTSALPADHLLELGEFLFLHENRVLLRRVAPVLDVVHVFAVALLEDRNEVAIDLRMARRVFLVEMEEVGAYDVDAVGRVAGAETDHRNGQGLGEVLGHLRGHDLGHDREAARVDERHRGVDELLGAIGRLALRRESTELRHAHRAYADVALHRYACLDDRFDVPRMVNVTLALHDLGAGLRDVLGSVVDGLLR